MEDKIWLVVPSFPLGGAERQLFELAKYNPNRFIIVDSSSTVEKRNVNGVDILGLGIETLHLNVKNRCIRRFFRYLSFVKLVSKINKNNVSKVVFYNPIYFILTPFLKFKKVSVVLSLREFHKKLFSPLYLYLIKSADYIYTNTPRVKEKLQKHNINCDLHLNYIDLKPLNKWKNNDTRTILVISNVEPHKNIHMLIDKVRDKNIIINVAGKISNIEYYNKCLRIANESLCEVNFLGSLSRDELDDYLVNTRCLVHPSILEGTSNAILDGIKFGTPILVSDIPENTFLVDNNNEFIFNDKNFEKKLGRVIFGEIDDKYIIKQEKIRKRCEMLFSLDNISNINNAIID